VRRYADAPLIICGDFNSLPDSGVYKFLRVCPQGPSGCVCGLPFKDFLCLSLSCDLDIAGRQVGEQPPRLSWAGLRPLYKRGTTPPIPARFGLRVCWRTAVHQLHRYSLIPRSTLVAPDLTLLELLGNFVGCLDYIFYSNDKLEVRHTLCPHARSVWIKIRVLSVMVLRSGL